MSGGYGLHQEAFEDLEEIRAYIADENRDAADRTISEIFDAIRRLVPFPTRATGARISVPGLCGLLSFVSI